MPKRLMVQCSSTVDKSAVSREIRDGAEHIIISSFTMPDNIVMNGILYPAAEIKRAETGFGEWLAITHGHEGIRVSLLCPQAVRTAMTGDGGAATSAASLDGLMEPEALAEIVVTGLREESFLILPHPEVLEYMRRKTSNYDRWISGMNRLYQRLAARA